MLSQINNDISATNVVKIKTIKALLAAAAPESSSPLSFPGYSRSAHPDVSHIFSPSSHASQVKLVVFHLYP